MLFSPPGCRPRIANKGGQISQFRGINNPLSFLTDTLISTYILVMALELSPETARIVRDTCICYNLQRAARYYARRHDEALRPAGLTNGQFAAMMMMMRPYPPTITALADEMAMDRTTLTALIKPLQRRRLIKASIDADDRRQRRLTLTGEGRRVLEQALPLWQTVQYDTRKSRRAAAIPDLINALELE